jgi:hypothetical protein
VLDFVSSIAALAAIACAQTPATDDVEPAATLTFDRTFLLEPEGATSANVSIGDLDQDGHLDVVLVKGRHWPLSDILLMGDGTGAFRPARAIASVEDRSYSGVLVDIDADGDLDVVVSNDHPDPNLVYLNNGRGEFALGSHFGKAEWPTRHVIVADQKEHEPHENDTDDNESLTPHVVQSQLLPPFWFRHASPRVVAKGHPYWTCSG